jgi:galactarate dehydratase
MGQRIFEKILATASGQRSCAERNGTHNSLVLFNPAPVT